MQKPTYVGVFLDGASRKDLLALVHPKHPVVYADHLTIAFGKAMNAQYPLGRQVMMWVTGEIEDAKAQAVTCAPDDDIFNLLAPEQIPHITISCAEGVKPVYSNELLKHQSFGRDLLHPRPLRLFGTLDYFPRTINEKAEQEDRLG